jgi:hypothetical protein
MTEADVLFIRDLIARNPGLSRRQLSTRLCEAWGWVQENGAPRDMVCRGLMLSLHRAGAIELPAHKNVPRNNLACHGKPVRVAVSTTPIRGRLSDLGELEFRLVRRTRQEPLFDSLIEEHHYLGYTRPVGEHLKYLVLSQGRPLACVAFSSAPRHLGPRDRFLGWSKEERRRNIRFVAYNPRYLILPWVEVRYLASHVLSRVARRLSEDWEGVYGHPVYFVETFVDPTRFRGTCYKAANWVFLGRTTGRGKDDLTKKPNRPIKDVLGYPLSKRFRELLRGAA